MLNKLKKLECIPWPLWPSHDAAGLAAWGNVFQIGTETVLVGQDINFNDNGPLKGINHTPGTAEIVVRHKGVYDIFFSIFTQGNNPEDWAVMVNYINRAEFNASGQAVSAATKLYLNAGDIVTIRNIATGPIDPETGLPVPAVLRTTNTISAYVLINKVDKGDECDR